MTEYIRKEAVEELIEWMIINRQDRVEDGLKRSKEELDKIPTLKIEWE